MSQPFFDTPILNSPYAPPDCHWELDDGGQPTDHIAASRRRSPLVSPIPKPTKVKGKGSQADLYAAADAAGVEQEYNPTEVINGIRSAVESWRAARKPVERHARHGAAAAPLGHARLRQPAPVPLPGRGGRDGHLDDGGSAALLAAGLDPRAAEREGGAGMRIVTMHEAKGLEFRAVVVMACDDDVLPDPARLAAIGDPADLQAAHEIERHLYLASTRARDRLMVSGVAPGSEFLDDLEAR